MTPTWQEVVDAKPGTILLDKFDEGLRFIIMRGPFNLCAYIGIPESHPLAGHGYEDLPVQCHGGLTFSSKARDQWPEGFWWYGWDYGHCDDYMISDHHSPEYRKFNEEHTKWGVDEVQKDAWSALYDFKKLAKLAERVWSRAKGETIS